MQFVNESRDSYAYAGTWFLSDDEVTYGDSLDYPVFTIEMDEVEDGVYEFEYYDCNYPVNSWYANVTVVFYGNITVYDADTGERLGNVWVDESANGDSLAEQLMLGVYDAIEAWFNDVRIPCVN